MAINWTNRRKILNNEEMGHLNKIAGCYTKKAFQSTINYHAQWRHDTPDLGHPCWECYDIAKKLGMKGVVD
ncbi:hypothetical protein KAR91_60330 [Candidatus Pacearchaeota archaeon]|nr:hypothetical protein [Candidatus Pacearchaeota archaeon]